MAVQPTAAMPSDVDACLSAISSNILSRLLLAWSLHGFLQVVHTGHNPPACPLLQATSAAQASASLWHTLSHTQRHIQSRRDTHSYIVTLTATQRHTQPHSHTQSHRDTHSHTETHTQSHTESQTHTRTHRLTWDRVLLHCCTVGFPPHQKIASS